MIGTINKMRKKAVFFLTFHLEFLAGINDIDGDFVKIIVNDKMKKELARPHQLVSLRGTLKNG